VFECSIAPTPLLLKHIIVKALRDLHGETGTAIPVDVLSYNAGIAVLRVPLRSDFNGRVLSLYTSDLFYSDSLRLRTALACLSEYDSVRCHVCVLASAGSPLGLACAEAEV
jgi:hypothetical protein